MVKTLLLLFTLFLTIGALAQDKNSTVINGQITGNIDEDVEGVAVYNTTSKRGTVSDADGNFTILVSMNDILYIKGLQFQERMITIDETIIQEKSLKLFLNTALNTLDEIVIMPHYLTGNLKIDANAIQINTLDQELGMSFANLDLKKIEVSDSQSSIKQNYSLQALGGPQIQNGINGMAILGLLTKNLFKKSTSKEKVINKNPTLIAEKIKKVIPETYFTEVLKLPENRVPEFLSFIEDEEFPDYLLDENNLLKLMVYLQLESENFLAL